LYQDDDYLHLNESIFTLHYRLLHEDGRNVIAVNNWRRIILATDYMAQSVSESLNDLVIINYRHRVNIFVAIEHSIELEQLYPNNPHNRYIWNQIVINNANPVLNSMPLCLSQGWFAEWWLPGKLLLILL
jgi:hypothetical protein